MVPLNRAGNVQFSIRQRDGGVELRVGAFPEYERAERLPFLAEVLFDLLASSTGVLVAARSFGAGSETVAERVCRLSPEINVVHAIARSRRWILSSSYDVLLMRCDDSGSLGRVLALVWDGADVAVFPLGSETQSWDWLIETRSTELPAALENARFVAVKFPHGLWVHLKLAEMNPASVSAQLARMAELAGVELENRSWDEW